MSTVTATSPTTNRHRAVTVALWAARLLLALAFVSAGAQKLAGTHYMVAMFAKIGLGQWLRYATGLIEITGAIGLLLPPLSGPAAFGLVTLMLGAIVTNVFIGYSLAMPIVFLLVSALLAWSRAAQTKEFAAGLRRGNA